MADVPLIGEQFSNWQVYYTPSAFRTSLNVSEKLTWNNTRTQIRSPDSYNFGLNRTMNLDHKFSNNLSSKYSWAGQSKLNDYRGYAWMAIKNLDPGIVTNTTGNNVQIHGKVTIAVRETKWEWAYSSQLYNCEL